MWKKGFTLIELLVVIAIIALLLSVMVPSLKTAKQYATSAACMSNQKSLSTAWTLYQTDNDGHLIGGSTYYDGTRSTPFRWCEKPLFTEMSAPQAAPSGTDLTMEYRLNGIRGGNLFDYTGSEDAYHCPSDRTFTKETDQYAVYRSYSIAGLMNGEDFIRRQSGIYSPIVEYRKVTFPTGVKTLYCVTKNTEIRSPGSKYVFVEENANKEAGGQTRKQEYLLGGFVLMNSNLYSSWWDFPAYYHNDMSTLGFADGHAEKRNWVDQRTVDLMKDGVDYWVFNQPDNEDLEWMIRGYMPK